MGRATAGCMVLGVYEKKAGQENKAVSSTPDRPLPQLLSPGTGPAFPGG